MFSGGIETNHISMSWILAVWLRNKLIQLDMFWKTIFQHSNCMCSNIPSACVRTFQLCVRTFQLHVFEHSNCMCSNVPTACVRTFQLHVFNTCNKHFEQSLVTRSKFNLLITIDLDCCFSPSNDLFFEIPS